MRLLTKLTNTYRKHRTVFRRYSMTLLAPLLLCIVLFLCIRHVTLLQVEKVGEYEVLHFSAEAHSILNEVRIISDSILADSRLADLVSGEADESDSYEISEILRDHTSKCSYISSTYLISERQGHIYQENAYFVYDSLDSILSRAIGETPDFLSSADNYGWHVLNANYASPYFISTFENSDAVLLIVLDKEDFIRTLTDTNAVISCMFDDNFCISSLLINTPGTDWWDESAVSSLAGEDVKCFFYDQDGYTYMTAIAMKDYNTPMRIVVVIFLIYFLAVLIFGIVYSAWNSRRSYKEMSALIDGLPQTTSGDSTYEEVSAAIRQSLNVYRQQQDVSLRQDRRALLQRLLGDSGKPADQKTPGAAGITNSELGYYVIIIRFAESGGIAPDATEWLNIDMTCTALDSAISKIIGDYARVTVTYLDPHYVAILSVLSPVVTHEDVRYILDEAVYAFEEGYGYEIKALASQPVPSVDQFPDAYRAVCSLDRYSESVGSTAQVLLQADMYIGKGDLMQGDFSRQFQIILSTIQLKKYDLLPQLVDTLIEEHITHSGADYALAQDRMTAVTCLLIEAVRNGSLSEEMTRRYVSALRQTKSIAALHTLTGQICASLLECSRTDAGEELVRQSCEFIAQNISNPNLSVPDVSAAAGVSVQHLSRLFRSRLDMTISERINSVRIETARQLILQKGMTVNRVAEAVGYNNAVTFSRNFHRYVGMSPSEYRELNRQQ